MNSCNSTEDSLLNTQTCLRSPHTATPEVGQIWVNKGGEKGEGDGVQGRSLELTAVSGEGRSEAQALSDPAWEVSM